MEEARLTMEQFLKSVERRAFRMAEISTGSADEALDIVQDAMFSMARRYAAKPRDKWKPLFYRIVQNRIRDWYRQQGVRKRWRVWLTGWSKGEAESGEDPLDTLADPAQKSPEEWAVIGDTRRALDQALKTLPPRQQQVFLLRAWEGLSVAETATAMRCSQGSVKTHYSRAVHALRERLEDHWP